MIGKREIRKKTVDNRIFGRYNRAITNDNELRGKALPQLFNTTPPQKRAKGENDFSPFALFYIQKGSREKVSRDAAKRRFVALNSQHRKASKCARCNNYTVFHRAIQEAIYCCALQPKLKYSIILTQQKVSVKEKMK